MFKKISQSFPWFEIVLIALIFFAVLGFMLFGYEKTAKGEEIASPLDKLGTRNDGELLPHKAELAMTDIDDFPFKYFIQPNIFVGASEYEAAVKKIKTSLPPGAFTTERPKADLVIWINESDFTAPGAISVNWRNQPLYLWRCIIENSAEAIVLKKEEEFFKEPAEKERKIIEGLGVSIKKMPHIFEKDFYRFLLRLRLHPDTIKLMRQVERLEIGVRVGDDSKYLGDFAIVDYRSNFDTLNDFLLNSILSRKIE